MVQSGTLEYCDGTFYRSVQSVYGGLARELGHVFGLPHPPGCEEGSPSCDTQALMWDGYDSYPNTYLRDDEKAVLLEVPFIGPDGMNVPALPAAALALLTVLILLAHRCALGRRPRPQSF